MRKKIGELLGTGLLLGLLLAFALILASLSGSQRVAQEEEATLTSEAVQATLTITSTAEVTSTVTPEPMPKLDDYVFGEPQIVLTGPPGIAIAEWLPDSHRLLIIAPSVPRSAQERIEILDTATSQVQLCGEIEGGTRLAWLSGSQEVLFTKLVQLNPVLDNLMIAGCQEGEEPQLFLEGGGQIAGWGDLVAVLPSGESRLRWLNGNGQWVSKGSVDLGQFGYTFGKVGSGFSLKLSPDGKRLLLENKEQGVLIVNVESGQLETKTDLGEMQGYGKRWAFDAQWSPDGRYLAMITTADDVPADFTNLTLLDATTGETHQIDLGVLYVYDIAWAPNSQYLLTLVQVNFVNGRSMKGLYLVNVLSGEFRHLLPNQVFGGGTSGRELAWSPDGQTVVTKCPVWAEEQPLIIEDRLCSISTIVQP
jgi:WD40 repeat protein